MSSATSVLRSRASVTPRSASAKERALFSKTPADIFITTPESLYLVLSSSAGQALRDVETVIVDEIHAIVSTKRGAHLAVTLERLQRLPRRPPPRGGRPGGAPA